MTGFIPHVRDANVLPPNRITILAINPNSNRGGGKIRHASQQIYEKCPCSHNNNTLLNSLKTLIESLQRLANIKT